MASSSASWQWTGRPFDSLPSVGPSTRPEVWARSGHHSARPLRSVAQDILYGNGPAMSEGLAALRLALRSGLAQGTIRLGRFGRSLRTFSMGMAPHERGLSGPSTHPEVWARSGHHSARPLRSVAQGILYGNGPAMSEGLAALRLALRSGLAQGTIRPAASVGRSGHSLWEWPRHERGLSGPSTRPEVWARSRHHSARPLRSVAQGILYGNGPAMSEGLAALRLALRSGLAPGTIRLGRFAPESNGGGGGSRTLTTQNIQVGEDVALLAKTLHFPQFPVSPGLCSNPPVTPATLPRLGNIVATT